MKLTEFEPTKTKINIINDDCFVVENIIPKSLQDTLENIIVKSNNFAWYKIDELSNNKYKLFDYEDENVTLSPGFFHLFYEDGQPTSEYSQIVYSVLDFLSYHTGICVDSILRIRARHTNKVPGHDENKYAWPHVDYAEVKQDYITVVYYLHDTDGDTIIYDKKYNPSVDHKYQIIGDKNSLKTVYRNSPKKGSAIVFNGHTIHAGNFPIENDYRIILNIDFIPKKDYK